MTYVELHCHSAFSFLDGASVPEELATRAADLGYPALALTDHDGVYGSLEFAHAAKALGVRPITGAEVSVADGSHLTLLVETSQGYANLCRILTAAHAGTRPPGKEHRVLLPPAVSLETVIELSEGLTCLSGCARSGLGLRHPNACTQLVEAFGRERFHVELQRPFERGDARRHVLLRDLAEHLGVTTVATGNVHAHVPRRTLLQDTLVAIRCCTALDGCEAERRGNRESVLRAPADMVELFSGIDRDAALRTVEIAERLEFDLTRELGYRYPDFSDGVDPAIRQLAQICEHAFVSRYDDQPAVLRAEARTRLEEELRLIDALGLAGFFLLHWEVLEIARRCADEVRGREAARHLLPPGRGRGSSVGSIVCYLTGLSHVDPVANRLSLGRFLNHEMASVPDIDLDFPRDIREKLIVAVTERYGHEHAALVATFATYRSRGAIRDVGKALGLPHAELERLARTTDGWSAEKVADEVAVLPDAQRKLESRRWRAFQFLTREIAGLPRHVSQHPGGMIISTRPLVELVPVQPAAMAGRQLCQWDKDSCADAGFLKIDLLGLGMLSCVEDCAEQIARVRATPIDLSRIPLDDPDVFAEIQAADTVGVFQIESRAQMQSLLRTRPETIDDLTVQVALVRPGPIQGKAVHPYIDNRKRLRDDPSFVFPVDHESLREPLAATLGVVVFQDQVLDVAMALARFSVGEAEGLRRAMSRKRSLAALESYRQRFVDGAIANGVTEETANVVYDKLVGFSGFGFPKSHAAAFGLLAYQSAWLRHHYPAEFLCALLNEQPMGFYPPASLVRDAQRRGVEVRPPDVNASGARCRLEDAEAPVSPETSASFETPSFASDGTSSGCLQPEASAGVGAQEAQPGSRASGTRVRPSTGCARASAGMTVRVGLAYVSSVGRDDAEAIEAEREASGPYRDVGDLARRARVSKEALQALVRGGACDAFGRRRDLLWEIGLATRPRSVEGTRGTVKQLALPLDPTVETPSLPELTRWERMLADYRETGMSVGVHPLTLLRPHLPPETLPSVDLNERPHGSQVAFAGLAVARQRPSTAAGIVFMLLEDEHGHVNLVVHPGVYEQHRAIVRGEPLLLVRGRFEHVDRNRNVIVTALESLSPLARRVAESDDVVVALPRAHHFGHR